MLLFVGGENWEKGSGAGRITHVMRVYVNLRIIAGRRMCTLLTFPDHPSGTNDAHHDHRCASSPTIEQGGLSGAQRSTMVSNSDVGVGNRDVGNSRVTNVPL